MDLQFHYQGITFTACDRCLDSVSVDIKSNFNSILKFGHELSKLLKMMLFIYHMKVMNIILLNHFMNFLLNFPRRELTVNKNVIPTINLMNKYSSSNLKNVKFDDRWSC